MDSPGVVLIRFLASARGLLEDSILKTGAFASLSDGMHMLALLQLEFGSGLFNRLTELRWQSEGLHDR